MRRGPYLPDVVRVEDMADYEKVQDTICAICGCRFSDHQPVPGYAWLHKLCDGGLVKL